MGQGLAALGAQGVGFVEDGGDAALFGEGREKNRQRLKEALRHSALTGASRHASLTLGPNLLLTKKVHEIPRIELVSLRPNDMEFG